MLVLLVEMLLLKQMPLKVFLSDSKAETKDKAEEHLLVLLLVSVC
jgi:hypothetical protein